MIHRIAILDCAHTCVRTAATQTSLPLCMQKHVQGIGSGLRSSLSLSTSRGLSNLRPSSRPAGGGEIRAFFHSGESECLQSDFKTLLSLGRKFGQFDRQGKVSYVDEMKKMVERWQIAYTRMESSSDSSAKHHATYSKVGPLGLTNVDLAKSLILVLDEMRQDAESGH